MDRVRRHLAIDPLEQRHLLSVSPISPFDSLINQSYSEVSSSDVAGTDPAYTLYNQCQTTYGAQSVGVDDDGDFVVVWSKADVVYDDFLEEDVTDTNIYARYFTDEVQLVTLPEAVATDNVGGSWGKFALTLGGNEVQKLTVDSLQMAYMANQYSSGISGQFDVGFDVDGNGTISAAESFTFTFNDYDPQGNATSLQNQLQALGGALMNVTVTALNPQEYYIYFNDPSGLNQPQIQVNPAFTTWDFFSEMFCPGVYTSTVSEPITVSGISVSSTNAQDTADLIESLFYKKTKELYLTGDISTDVSVVNGEADELSDTTNYGTTSTYANWKVEVTPVEGSLTQFYVTFTGAASKINVPLMKFESIVDDMGNDLLGTTEEITTIKESSDEFRVNDPEVDNAFTPYLDFTTQTAPAVAMDADGDFVITWQSQVDTNSTDTEIYARRFSPAGWTATPSFISDGVAIQGVVPLGNAFHVNTVTNGPQSQPAIGMDFDGNFVIAWVNYAQDLSYFNNVSAQVYNRDGERVGGEFVVVDSSGETDTAVHFDPYVSLSDDGYMLFTWSETEDAGYVNGTFFTSVVWAKLIDPNFGVLDTWEVPAIASQSSSIFDSGNNFTIVGTDYVNVDSIPGQGMSTEVYAVQYALDEAAGTTSVSRSPFRVNSASFSASGTPIWSGDQFNPQAMTDADGDITFTYEGYGPDTSIALYLLDTSVLSDVINATSNSDLVPFLTAMMGLYPATGSGTVNDVIGWTGDLDAEIEYLITDLMTNYGMTLEQACRFRIILNEKVQVYRGDPNGIMYTSMNAFDDSAQKFLTSDSIVNVERDSTNQRYLISIPSEATGGSFTIRIWRETYDSFGMPSTDLSTTGLTTITITPVIKDGVVDADATALAIHDALEASGIFGENTSGDDPDNIAVRRVDGTDEWDNRLGTSWEWHHTYPNDYVYEITFQNAAHDTVFDIEIASSSLTPTGTPPAVVQEYMRADDGLIQTQASSGMTPEGSFVVAWTQYEEYTDGTFSNTNIYFREYEESYDSAGARVTDMLLPDGSRLVDGGQVNNALSNIVVTFTEQLATSGEGSVLDPDNWALMTYDDSGNLVEVRGGISAISFGMNEASSLASTLGLNPLGSNKWEAVLTLDANGTDAGVEALGDGTYIIVAKSSLRDPSLNPLGFTGFDIDGADYLTSFTVSLPTGSETLVNTTTGGVQETLPVTSTSIDSSAFPNSPQAIAGDADGECVVVWTESGSGVYAKVYPIIWVENSAGKREAIQELPIELQVTNDATAFYASVARDGDGDFVVTWTAKTSGGDWNIWYRTFDSKGRATSDAQMANSTLTGAQQFSTVAMDNDGDFVITWQSQNQDGSGYGIYAQRFTPDGQKLGGLNEIQTLKLGGEIDLASFALNFDYTTPGMKTGTISYNASEADAIAQLIARIQNQINLLGISATVSQSENDETLILIEFIGVDGNKNQSPILLETYSLVGGLDASLTVETPANNNGMTSEFLVNMTTAGNQMWPSIAMDQTGNFVITWTGFGQDGDTSYQSNIYARKFNSNDTLLQRLEDIERNGRDASGINAETFNSLPYGSEFLVNYGITEVWDTTTDPPTLTETVEDLTSAIGNQKWSSVAMDADGDFVITWTSYNQDGVGNGYGPGNNGENGIFARRFDRTFIDASSQAIEDADDTDPNDDTDDEVEATIPLFSVFQVNTFAENDQQHSSVAMDSDGDFIITWESYQEKPAVGAGPDAATSFGIYAQRYVKNDLVGTSDSYGTNGEVGGEIHVNTTTTGDQRFPSVTIDDTGDAIIVWNGTSTLDPNGGIFMQRFQKLADDTGPRVTEVQTVSPDDGSIEIETLRYDESTENDVAQLIITFGENLNTEFLDYGENSILNLENWELCRLLSNGGTTVIEGGIASVTFGKDEAFNQGLASLTTGKYQAVVTLDYSDYQESGNAYLTTGKYVLRIKQEVQDLFENAIQPNQQRLNVSDYEFVFSVKDSNDGETPLIPIGTDSDLTNGQTYPETPSAVAVDGDGDYVVAWTAFDTAIGADRVYIMRFDTSGTPLWAEPRAVTPTGFGSDAQRYASVACDPDGDFVVTWTNYRDEDGSTLNGQEQVDVYAQRYTAAGVAQGKAFRVNSYTAGDQLWSNVAMDVEGGFVITWTSKGQENSGLPGYGYGVYARQFDPLGYALASEFQVNTTSAGNQQFSSVAVSADGTFVVVWQSDQNGIGKDIVARVFNPDGSPQISALGGEYVVNDVASGDQTYPDVAIDLAGETFVVTWTSTQGTDDDSGSGVYTKAFDVLTNADTQVHYEYTGDPVDVPHMGAVATEIKFKVEEGFLIEDLNVQINIQHDDPSDLWVWLVGPDGTEVLLFSEVPLDGDLKGVTTGANGANFIDTIFDDDADTAIDDDSVLPPFTGTYSPLDALSVFNNTSALGWWTLKVLDNDPSSDPDKFTETDDFLYDYEDGGRVFDFSIDFVRQPDISQEILVNTTTTGNQLYSSIGMDYLGNYVVTWCGYGDQPGQEDLSEYGIFSQTFALPGEKIGTETRVNRQTVGRQWIPSVGMDAAGNFVTVWTGVSSSAIGTNVYAHVTQGTATETSADTAGPVVGGIYNQGQQLFQGEVLAGTVYRLTVSFNEDMNKMLSSGGSSDTPEESIYNLDNWTIRLNGSEIISGISSIKYGYNNTTGKYEATVTFDGNGLSSGTSGLTAGQYELILRDVVTDAEGNRLDGDYDGDIATDTSTTDINGYVFRFIVSDTSERWDTEVRANDNTELVQLLGEPIGTGLARETSVRSTAINDNGDYVVVWTSTGQDDEDDPDGNGVYFQLYNADGSEKPGGPVRVNNILTGNQQNASVAMDSAGDFVIVWESEQADGTYDVYCQRFNADGSRVANERTSRIDNDPLRNTMGFTLLDVTEDLTTRGLDAEDIETLVNTTRNYNQFNPEVAMDSYGNYAIVWGSASTAYSYFNNVNIQLFDYEGEPLSDELYLNELYTPGSAVTGSVPGFKVNPSVAMDDNGRIGIVWDQIIAQSNGVAVETEVVGLLLTMDDTFTYLTMEGLNPTDDDDDTDAEVTELTIEDVSGDITADVSRTARNPQIALDSYGRGVVVYEAYVDADNVDEDDSLSYGIFYSVFEITEEEEDTTGGTDDDEEETGPPPVTKTVIEVTEGGQANIVLEYEPPDEETGELSDASKAALAFVGDQVNPSVAMDANGNFAITWNGPGAQPDPLQVDDPGLLVNADDAGVWIRWFNANGDPITVQQRVNTTETGTQQFSTVAMNRDGDVVVAWAGMGVGDRHGVFSRQYDSTVSSVGALATELYHRGVNPNVGEGDSYLFIADGDQVYGNPTSLLVVFSEEMDTSLKSNNTPGIHSVENVNNWTMVNGKGEEVSGAISHIEFYREPELDKWVAEVFFTDTAGLDNGTYTLIARTNIWDADGNLMDKTGYRPNGTGMNYGDQNVLDDDTDEEEEEEEEVLIDGFGFQFRVNNTLPGDPNWGDVDQQVNTEEYGREDSAAIARNASGNYVVAWVEYVPVAYIDPNEGNDDTDDDDDGGGTDVFPDYTEPWFLYEANIMVQQFDFWGREVGSQIMVNSMPIGTLVVDVPIDVAIDDQGNFVVVWSGDNTLIEGEDGIFMQRFDYDGDKMGGQVRVNEYRNDTQTDPSVAMDVDGDFVVTWTSFKQDGNQDAIVARRYNLNGVAQGSEFIVNSYTQGAQRSSDVAMDAAGNFVVTWQGEEYNGTGWGIYARRFYANGTAMAAEFHVNTHTASDQITPAVAMDSQGNFVVTWASYVQSGNSVWDIYARRYNSSGVAQGSSDFLVNQTTAYNQIEPDVAMSTGKGFVITWSSFNQDYPYDQYISDYGVYARMYNPDGTDYIDTRVGTSPIGEFQVNAETLGDQRNSAVSMDAGGHYVVVWTGPNRPDTTGYVVEGDSDDTTDTTTTDTDTDSTQNEYGNWVDEEGEALEPYELVYVERTWTEPDEEDTGGSTDDEEFDPQTLLEQVSTSIYSRLIDPPIVITASSTPQDVSILGTSGNDTIEFIGSPTSTGWVIKVNGVLRTITENIGTLTFNGLGGTDTFVFTGAGADDVISLAPGTCSFISNYYTIVATNFETVKANGGTGNNSVSIQDSSADDTLTIRPGLATMTGGNLTLEAQNCATILATSATGGQDTVHIYDTTGNDTFTTTPTNATMTGTGYEVVAEGFRYVLGYSTAGTDTAHMYDSEGNDKLLTQTAYAKLTGDGFYTIANNFRYINAYASGGVDTATMYDSAGDDTFEANPAYAKFTSSTYYVRADYFESVNAKHTAGGNDTAKFYGTINNDTIILTPEYGKLISHDGSFEIRADGFKTILGYGQGGTDTATIYDSTSDDTVRIMDNSFESTGANHDHKLYSFSNIKMSAVNGGNDQVTLYDSIKSDLLEAEDDWARMSSAEMEYTYTVLGFDQVKAYGTTAGDKKKVNQSVDFLFALGLWEDMD